MIEEDPWANDLLGRKADGEHLVKLLLQRYQQRKDAGQKASYILNINAGWGEGKTFFITALQKQLSALGHPTAYINAWADDLAQEPLITVMATIDGTLRPFFENNEAASSKWARAKQRFGVVALEAGKQLGKHALRKLTGIALDDIAEYLRLKLNADDKKASNKLAEDVGDSFYESASGLIADRIGEHNAARSSLNGFKQDVSSIISEAVEADDAVKAPLFVFVDELDRCRPTYAISLLEDMKHLFDIDGVVFVVATDTEQLAHSVKAVYGEGFAAFKYLRRFFDRTFLFSPGDDNAFVMALLKKSGVEEHQFYEPLSLAINELIVGWTQACGLSKRDFEQCWEIIETFMTSWTHKVRVEPIYLLCLTYSVYEQDWGLFRQLQSGCFPQDSPSPMASWILYGEELNGQPSLRGERAMSVIDLIGTDLKTSLDSSLLEDTKFGNEYWGIVRDNEKRTLYPQGLQRSREYPTVMNDYVSLIRNAGRLVRRA